MSDATVLTEDLFAALCDARDALPLKEKPNTFSVQFPVEPRTVFSMRSMQVWTTLVIYPAPPTSRDIMLKGKSKAHGYEREFLEVEIALPRECSLQFDPTLWESDNSSLVMRGTKSMLWRPLVDSVALLLGLRAPEEEGLVWHYRNQLILYHSGKFWFQW
jgi:hypothetical protein